MIRHTVVFKLKHPAGSQEEQNFLNEARKLVAIPGVQQFECLKQISPKNPYDFGLSMEFASQEQYDAYNNHPDHVHFVEQFWLNNVTEFLEIDYLI
ncbi:Dabb family protein [Larkinella punicea]|uniref:Dabb family protein n=1 Tax=Larkinella punicea TaxID=2315727 RepID=A0A368JIS0_9BACT|nr:Dabb family protein [Larkinella punicea]RCR67557.1 Dabb family protein [Larkinella punicea]